MGGVKVNNFKEQLPSKLQGKKKGKNI